MSTKLFNFTNQRLNSDKLREILSFNSDGFGGIIIDNDSSPFSVSGNQITLNAQENSPITFLGGGLLLNQTSSVSESLLYNNQLWVLQVILDSNVSTILSDELEGKISFTTINCDFIDEPKNYYSFSIVSNAEGSPKLNNYYELEDDNHFVLSTDETVIYSKIYYYRVELTSFKFMASEISTSTYSYLGNTIWISDNTFIIPLFARINDKIIQLVNIKTKSDFEKLLSSQAYSRLKNYCEGTFVWSSGGRELVTAPDGTTHMKGDVGGLNITEGTIFNSSNNNSPVRIQNLTIANLSNENNDKHTKLVVSSNGNISVDRDYVLSVEHGGTGATNRNEAKSNLGIYYGKSQTPSGSYQEGDIYLQIIE